MQKYGDIISFALMYGKKETVSTNHRCKSLFCHSEFPPNLIWNKEKMTVWHSIIRLLSSVGVTPKFIFRWKGTAAKPPFTSTPLKAGIVISTVGRNLKYLIHRYLQTSVIGTAGSLPAAGRKAHCSHYYRVIKTHHWCYNKKSNKLLKAAISQST